VFKANKLRILALVKFTSQPHTAMEYAVLALPGYPSTKVGTFKRLYKSKVKRHPRQSGGGYVFWFWDLPAQWRRDIMHHFMSKDQPQESIQQVIFDKKIDAIMYAAGTVDKRFALEWSRCEKLRDEAHRRIIDILTACKETES